MINNVKTYELRIPSQTDNLEIIREMISKVARKVGFGAEDINKIELAVDEACTNAIEHAYQYDETQNIDIAIKIDYDKLTVIITDKGKGFKFNDVELPEMKDYLAELRVGGLGIYLIKTLMDEVEYESQPGVKNQVRMSKYFIKKN